MTTPATETKSIGLLDDASASWRIMVFAPDSYREPLKRFYHDGTNPAHLSGLSHLDSFIMTQKLLFSYRDFAKTHANPDSDGNSLYHRVSVHEEIR